MVHWPMVNGVNMLSTYVTLGDGRSSQGRFGDKRNAECIDKQGDAEQQVAPEKYLTHITLYYSF